MCQLCQATQTFDPTRHTGDGPAYGIINDGVGAANGVGTSYTIQPGTYYGPAGVSNAMLSAASEVATLDQLADYLTEGYWASLGVGGRSFNTSSSNQITVNVTSLPPESQELARAALQAWEMVADLVFVEVSGTAQITFSDSEPGLTAYTLTTTSGATILNADVIITDDWVDRYGTTADSYSFATYIHEIGHALGLGHQGAYDASAVYGEDETFANDSWQVSVMSYFSQTQNTTTDASYANMVSAMMADIVAIQNLYGAPDANSATGGDTIWGGRWSTLPGYLGEFFRQLGTGNVDPNIYADGPVTFTIYDQGGTDIIDLSFSTTDDRIDLNDASFSDVFGLFGSIGIARDTIIENLNTGSANDRVTGNEVANAIFTAAGNDRVNAGDGDDTVSGGSGNDTLLGAAGDDRLWGGEGQDSLLGDVGNDTLGGGGGNDIVDGAEGDDRLWGGNGADIITGGVGNDTVGGGEGNDVISGNDGDDLIVGGGGSDAIDGGNGNDAIYGDGSVDTISGGDGNDTLDGGNYGDLVVGGEGDDLVLGGEGNDSLVGGNGDDDLRGGTQADTLNGDDGNDRLFGEQGWDQLFGGSGNDTMTGGTQSDTFVFIAGADIITDFNLAERDRVQLDDALWGGTTLTETQVINTYGGVNGNGDFVLSFGPSDSITFEGITTTAGLADAFDFV